jgi:hypothetical protein
MPASRIERKSARDTQAKLRSRYFLCRRSRLGFSLSAIFELESSWPRQQPYEEGAEKNETKKRHSI